MATWTTNTTTTDDSESGLLQKIIEKLLGIFKIVGVFLFFLILVMAECFSVPKISLANSNSDAVRAETHDLISSGATKELEFSGGPESDNRSDMDLYNTMMTLVTNMRYGDFELDGAKAQEFWTAYAPKEKSDTKLEYLRFQSENRRVSLRYSNGIASEITVEFDDNYFCKAVYLRKDIFNGNPLRWLYWKAIGRFVSGYPCYVTEANLNGNGVNGSPTLQKYVIRNQIFSWSFTPGKRQRIENITKHWTSKEPTV